LGPPGRVAAVPVLILSLAAEARADPPDHVTFQARRVEADPGLEDVTLEGGVDVRYGRYRLRGERLHLRFERGAVVFDGDAHLAFCSCERPPFTFAAQSGRVEPTGDLFLRLPRLEVAGLPVLALPYLWLRPPDRPGLLPPIVALRGADGLLLGSGVHLPWRGADGAARALDLTAGVYFEGGAEIGAALATPDTTTKILADEIHGTRVAADARGSVAMDAGTGLAWSLDAIRGDRALSGTVDLAPAALPFDTGEAEASRRGSLGAVSVVVAGGATAWASRGDGAILAGPRASLGLGGAIGGVGAWSAEAGGVVLGNAAAEGALPLGRVAGSAEIDARPGPFELRATARARGRVATDPEGGDTSSEAAAALGLDLELPFARAFAVAGGAPLVHWIIPAITLRGAVSALSGPFFVPIGVEPGAPPASWIAASGVSTALGRYAGPAIRLDLRAGAAGDASSAQGLLHAQLGVEAPVAAASIEAAAVGERAGVEVPCLGAPAGSPCGSKGFAALARTRVGSSAGPWIRVELAAQTGDGAGRARAIDEGAWGALPADALVYLATSGVTGGAEVSIPWASVVRTGARADVDFDARALLAVKGLAEYRHPCGCFGLGLVVAHRVGREGVDAAVTVDVVPPARRAP
jgi:hypothetical protein